MKKQIFKNFGYKILAVFFAILLWLVVINITDYTITVKIEDIPVEQKNTDVLDELEQVYDVVKGDTVDIYVKGRRSVVSNLTADNFYAYADVSQMSITNSVQIYVEPRNKSIGEDISIDYADNIMQLSLEDKVTEQFPVKVVTKGELITGYAIGETYATPNIITIEGPKSAVEKITDVTVTVDVNNAKENITAVGNIEILDAYGEQIKNDKLIISQETADVTVNVYPVKTVDVYVDIKGTPMDGYAISDIVYQPQTVEIAGSKDNISDIDEIKIDDISVSGLSESLQTTVNLEDYLPDNIVVAQQSSEIAITVDIEKLISKSINVSEDDIAVTGRKSGYTYEIEMSDNFIVQVSGLENIIKDTEISDLNPRVNFSGLEAGTYNLELELKEIDGITYDVTGAVTVNISKNN